MLLLECQAWKRKIYIYKVDFRRAFKIYFLMAEQPQIIHYFTCRPSLGRAGDKRHSQICKCIELVHGDQRLSLPEGLCTFSSRSTATSGTEKPTKHFVCCVFNLLSSANAVFVREYLMLWYPSNLLPCFTSIVLLNVHLLYSLFRIADFTNRRWSADMLPSGGKKTNVLAS